MMRKVRNWKVLVTDGDALHSLAIVRSLGSKGMKITVSSRRKITSHLSLSFYSRYCRRRLFYPDPETREAQFIHFLEEELKLNKYDILLPVRSTVTPLVAKHEEKLRKYANFVIPSKQSMEIANNKEETFKFAEKIGVPIPKTFYPQDIGEIEQAIKELSFPLVVKAPFGAGSTGVSYVETKERLFSVFDKYFAVQKSGRDKKPMVQELIRGNGYGFFSIFDHGEPKAIFMHKRIREYPITGGPSTVAESYYNERLKELGLKILRKLEWNGVAMVEFKRDEKDNEFKLMEVNPKFWGSLNLAIASGVDFPYFFCLQAMGEKYEPVFEYKKGVRFRWLIPGDLMHGWAYFLEHYRFPKGFFKDLFADTVKYDISLSDPKPAILEIFYIAGYLYRNRLKIRYPFGNPFEKDKDLA